MFFILLCGAGILPALFLFSISCAARYIRIHGEGQVGRPNAFVAYEEVTPIYSKAGKSIYETVGPKKQPAKK